MKKALLSAAVLSAITSGAAFAANVYSDDTSSLDIGGRAEGRFNISDNNESATTSSFEDKSRARVNIVGNTKISEGLVGFGKYEAELNTSDAGTINNRYAFAGIGTNFGKFSYGKQDSAQVMLTDITDTMATFGADAADIVDGNKDKRANNFLYSGQFNALAIQANYVAANEKDRDSFGVAGLYSLDFGLDLGLGYVSQANGNDDNSQINFVAQYGVSDLTLGFLYGYGDVQGQDASAIEFSAKYALNQWEFVGVYNNKEVDADVTDKEDNVALEAVYKFNGNLRTYAGYKVEMLDNKDNQLQAGIRYDF